MPKPRDAESFLGLLQESKLLSPEKVRTVVDNFQLEEAESAKQAAQKLVTEKVLTRYQGERLLAGRTRGFFIDRYKVLEVLGFGGMGSLYLAEDVETTVPVALKVLNDKCRNDAGMLTRLKLEATAGARLEHPHVVRTIKYDDTGAICYIAMEFIKGISLLELVLLRQKSLPTPQVCDVILQAALGLQNAHEAGIVHRDLKPENLIIDSQGLVKVLDFGLALLKDNPEAEFSLSMIFGHGCVGTPEYIAPEQSRDGSSVDSRTDVYSLGCTMYFLLTGKLPFPKGTVSQKIQAHREQTPRPITEIAPKVPADVIAIVEKMMAKRPEDRYQSMEEVVEALKPFAKRTPVEFRFNKIVSQRVREAKARSAIAQSSIVKPQLSSRIATASHVAEQAQQKTEGIERLTRGESDISKSGILRHAVPAESTDQMAQQATNALSEKIQPIEIISIDDKQRFPITRQRVVLGRNADCDIQFNQPGISGEHCAFHFENTGWVVSDLNSKNGIEVDGRRIQEQIIFPGNTLTLAGKYHFRVASPNQYAAKGKHKNLVIAASVLVGIGLIAGIGYWLLS
ncbi:FHA domain-containing serine/threonine-protein kinase [Gimesia fumaroli]|uniref:Serine/threonine-protein kinase PknB n=1 Tax=Gimesia fumaroli TaxID=2527976 RepID=A0A518I791_9PLAN|nr:FHA domain-containing serine/threonine-protein kinase [Gimesia fumaroli]QDV48953.1 Serine/threonine-protein kinase PknB [Gimesia fumaroli]